MDGAPSTRAPPPVRLDGVRGWSTAPCATAIAGSSTTRTSATAAICSFVATASPNEGAPLCHNSSAYLEATISKIIAVAVQRVPRPWQPRQAAGNIDLATMCLTNACLSIASEFVTDVIERAMEKRRSDRGVEPLLVARCGNARDGIVGSQVGSSVGGEVRIDLAKVAGVGTVLAEAIYSIDSVAVADLLHLVWTHPHPPDRLTLAIVSIDDMLATLGFDELQRLDFYVDRVPLSTQDGREYRKRKIALARLLGSGNGAPADVLDPSVSRILAARHRALNPIANELSALEREGPMRPSRPALCGNYVHMHCNRLTTGPALDQLALQLLRRTRESLRVIARS